MALHPRGINHLAIGTRDIKRQISFFTDVLGCELKALFWMHGLPGAWHGFIELSPECYLAFVQHNDNPDSIINGVTHAGTPTGNVSIGAMQHLAMHLDTLDELEEFRDRIRSSGVMVFGPIDHGFCHSIYFAGPEGLVLELTAGVPLDPRAWIDPEVVQLAGISDAELARFTSPKRVPRTSATAVPQPELNRSVPHFDFPDSVYEFLATANDEQIAALMADNEPPVKVGEK
ncbi:VOC family protein (plasmid) [Rhodococcoides fascians A21d2]|uniref:VOC family protein n=1 Tax=Rhodococcoides fascians TaxID=1828 RepID=UPI0005635C05|nr:VOC family protein [Rhodococcus fascians]QII03788.1 VOC family protein [Rhodococcus fascians A21d2]